MILCFTVSRIWAFFLLTILPYNEYYILAVLYRSPDSPWLGSTEER